MFQGCQALDQFYTSGSSSFLGVVHLSPWSCILPWWQPPETEERLPFQLANPSPITHSLDHSHTWTALLTGITCFASLDTSDCTTWSVCVPHNKPTFIFVLSTTSGPSQLKIMAPQKSLHSSFLLVSVEVTGLRSEHLSLLYLLQYNSLESWWLPPSALPISICNQT